MAAWPAASGPVASGPLATAGRDMAGGFCSQIGKTPQRLDAPLKAPSPVSVTEPALRDTTTSANTIRGAAWRVPVGEPLPGRTVR